MILYKYYPPSEYAFKSLAVKGIWCHHPANMNDPFECLGMSKRKFSSESLRVFKKLLSTEKSGMFENISLMNDQALTNEVNKMREKHIVKFAFCAVSETMDDILMWSHYSKAHTGFVIGFDFSHLKNDFHLQKVSYKKKLEEVNLKNYAEWLLGNFGLANFILKDISVKSIDWEREKEWRIWRNRPCYFTYKPEQVKEIYFGINTPDDVKYTVLELTSYLPDNFTYCDMEFKNDPIRLMY